MVVVCEVVFGGSTLIRMDDMICVMMRCDTHIINYYFGITTIELGIR